MISVRKAEYHGTEGFLICGRREGQEGGFGVSIFCLTRPVAEKIREAVKIDDRPGIDRLLREEVCTKGKGRILPGGQRIEVSYE